jgi:hypothetical protein
MEDWILFQRKVSPTNPNYILGVVDSLRQHTRHSVYRGRQSQKGLYLVGCDPAINIYSSIEGRVITKPALHGPWSSDHMRHVRVGFESIREHLRITEGFRHYADLLNTPQLFEIAAF